MDTKKTLFLLDGHALVYRAHYAFITRPLINSKGMNTSAATGFVRTLWEIIKNQQPSHIAVAFDLSGKTFRNDLYPEYKANRDAQPEDITIALPYIKDIVRGFNIPIIEVENYEADDVIGTIAKQAEKEGFQVYMVTPDKDYAQLVSDNIFIYKPSKKNEGVEILGVPEVLEKWDIQHVDQVVDILGMQGDSVDNIPGIPGVGPKTATKMLKDYGSLESVLANVHKFKGKQHQNLIDFADQARLSKVLAKIDTEVPVQFDAEYFKTEKADKAALELIFADLEFRTLADQILQRDHKQGVQADLFANAQSYSDDMDHSSDSSTMKTIESSSKTYVLVDTDQKRAELVKALSGQQSFCFDTETTGLDPHQARIVGVSFSWEKDKAYYLPLNDSSAEEHLSEFRHLFEDERISKRGQNIKYDMHILRWAGIEVLGKLEDSMLMHYLLEPEHRHNMDYLASTYLDYRPVSIEKLIGKKGKNQRSMADLSPTEILDYAAEDADVTNQLVDHLLPILRKDEKVYDIYINIEGPLIRVLADMEYQGVRIDSDYLGSYSRELAQGILAQEDKIYEIAGASFNISSPKQVGDILFNRMKIPYRWTKTKSGQYSTDEAKLSELAHEHEIVDHILHYRGLSKLKSTYVDSLPKLVNPRDGRIHSSFNQALAATGRLSSTDPNLQNIPIRTPEGRKIREAFIPRSEEYVLLAADYSQVELRLIAEISGDEAMLEAFYENKDIHSATAARVFGVPYDEVTKDQRRQAKTVNFSIIYGAGASNLSRQLDIPRTEAKVLIESYFQQYKGLKSYMDSIVASAREQGYVETLLGRKRHLRDINSRNSLARSAAERIAVNTPIQGTAADLIKIAMINIYDYLRAHHCKTKMIMQVHDELVFDLHKDEKEVLVPVIEAYMRDAMPEIKVPLLVESNTGENWLVAH